jgi:integrase
MIAGIPGIDAGLPSPMSQKPSQKLTKRVIDACHPLAKDRLVFDSEVRGFGLKVTPAGRKVYVLQYRMGGRASITRRYTIGEHGGELTADQARAEAIRLRGRIRMGIDPQEEKKARSRPLPKARSFAATAEDYLRHIAKTVRPSTAREWSRIIAYDVAPAWGDRAILAITRAHVRELVEGIARRGAEVQANRTLACLKTLFNWAVAQDIIPASPAAGLKPVAREIERDRVLSADEIRWFWSACDRLGWPFGPLFKLLLLTAQRRDAVGTLEWSHLSADRTTWTMPRGRSKNDRAHEVQLAPLAQSIIAALPVMSETLVFTTTRSRPVSGFSTAKAALDRLMESARREELGLPEDAPAAIAPWILHDLRRTAATGMARLNVPPHVVDKILNHVSGSIRGVAAIYNRHSYLAERGGALAAWARQVEALLADRPANVVPLARSG